MKERISSLELGVAETELDYFFNLFTFCVMTGGFNHFKMK